MNGSQLASEADALAGSTLAQQFSEPQTILLVEDETFVREMMCEILETAGYRVLKARNAAEAKVAFERCGETLQLLLTDVVLPGQNGCELANDLKAISPRLLAILVSGYPENVVTRNGVTKSGTFYFPKPFSADSLLRKVRQVLAKDLQELAI